MNIHPEAPLTEAEIVERKKLEARPKRNGQMFVEFGSTLAEIRDRRLWRDFDTFDTYCRERWGLTKSHAHQLIHVWDIARRLPEDSRELLRNSCQGQALSQVAPPKRDAVIHAAKALAEAEGHELTVKHLTQAATHSIAPAPVKLRQRRRTRHRLTLPEYNRNQRVMSEEFTNDATAEELLLAVKHLHGHIKALRGLAATR